MIPHTDSSRPLPSCRIIDLYAVQKCWYSGPLVTPTVDYLRLLRTPREAEQIAYHSAHGWAQSSAVRTIALPAHPSQHAFVAAGQVFWIRRVRAQVVATASADERWDHAHCIVAHGILGGSGGSVRRRDAPEAPIRIFVGPQSAHRALQLIAGGAVPAGSTVQWVPVGAPPTVQHIPNEWPSAGKESDLDGNCMEEEEEEENVTTSHHDKRTLEENRMNTVWYSSSNRHLPAVPKNTDPFVAWHPPSPTWESRPHKRPCRPIVVSSLTSSSTWYPPVSAMEQDVTVPQQPAMME
jgi:hypothetical protein